MDKSKLGTVAAVLIGVVGLGLGLGWFATRSTTSVPAAPPPMAEPAPEPQANPPRPPRPTRSATIVRPPVVQENPAPVEPAASAVPQGTNLVTDWEDRLDEILGAEDEDTNKVVQLLALFPRLPTEGQDEVAQHLSNLVEDENYEPLLKFALDPSLPEDVLDTFLADLLNRPNATKLPAFLEIASIPNHPKAEEARELLELYLEEEEGELSRDRTVLQQKIQEWLKENPD